MANEFDKRVENDENIWSCRMCNIKIRSRSKPRDHIYNNHGPTVTTVTTTPGATTTSGATMTTTPSRGTGTRSSASAPGTPLNFPPPPTGNTPNGQQFHQKFGLPNMNDPRNMKIMQAQITQAEQFQQSMMLQQKQNDMILKQMQMTQDRLQVEQEKRDNMAQLRGKKNRCHC